MSRMRRTAFAALVVVALAPAGCGDSSRAEFIAKTDAQCKRTNVRTKALNEAAARAAASAGSDAQVLRALAPILRRSYGQVRDNAAAFEAESPPPADAAEVKRIRKLYDEQAKLARKLAVAAKRGDIDEFRSLTELQKDLVARARRATRAYGFKECGSTKSDA